MGGAGVQNDKVPELGAENNIKLVVEEKEEPAM